MSWQGPGFVDHHTHLLRVAAGVESPYGSPPSPERVRAYHRRASERWSSPMDEIDGRPLDVDDRLRGALERGLTKARERGLVQVTEAGMDDWAYLEALLGLRARDELAVRVRIFVASGIADLERMAALKTGDPWLEVVGVKFYADGWIGPRTAAMEEPWADAEGLDGPPRGYLFLDADTLASRADPFAEAGWTIATHAIGDRAIATVLDAYEKIYGSDTAAAAPRIEHAQVLDGDLVRRMAERGVVACIQPGFAVSDAADSRLALGGERWDDAYRWDTLLDAGVPVIAGSDFPIEKLSPLIGLQRLVTGDFEDGRRAGAATLPLERALAVMTDPSAGTTVLSDDPRGVAEDELTSIQVEDARPAG